ncbi:hypothetical protein WICPIJ_004111 [Wickerhamomyces pijperi]|uniref:Pheromone-regulated membrane protein 10 n=1 Tax=Wickerhamomyces pijperi TaxID=599730 RepID=A0A9P8Q8P8_WICPI|nr:hypothetical protein WICPIJ_004111 [Wickerhamomyces pijperi]
MGEHNKGSKNALNPFHFNRSSSSTDQQQLQGQSQDFSFPAASNDPSNTKPSGSPRRPTLRPSYSAGPKLHHSSSSLLTISKLYNPQQSEDIDVSSPTTPSQQFLSPNVNPLAKQGSSKSKPSHFDIKNKKLHKRVLSSSSLNDYFSTAARSVDNHTPSSTPQEKKAPKLPSFQRVEPSSDEASRPSAAAAASPGESFDRLSSSAIFERRMAREKQGIDDLNDEFLTPSDQSPEILSHAGDEQVNQMYQEKLNKMKDGNEMFYTTDSESDVQSVQSALEYHQQGDVVHEEPNVEKSDKVPQKQTEKEYSSQSQDTSSSDKTNTASPSESDANQSFIPSSSQQPQQQPGVLSDVTSSRRSISRKGSLISGSSSNSNSENKFQGFKNAFKRFVLDEDDEDLGKPEQFEDSSPVDANGGLLSKMMGFSGSGGGLAPGAATEEERKKPSDEENQMITADEGIELQQMDPRIFQKEAHDILEAHSNIRGSRRNAMVGQEAATNGIIPEYDPNSEETTLKGSSSSFDESFTAPNPDLYLRDHEMTLPHLDDGESSYIPPPERVRGGVLSSLLRLYQNPNDANRSRTSLMSDLSPTPSAITTPINEEDEFQFGQDDFKDKPSIGGRLKALANSAVNAGHIGAGKKNKKVAIDDENLQEQQDLINAHKKNLSFVDASQFTDEIPSFLNKKSKSSTNLPSFSKNRPKPKKAVGNSSRLKAKREQAAARITVHIADILQRQRFILRMCKALMLYGAPTHRLEEYLTMTARVLEIDGQFIYFPGCMIVSFGDATTRTSEVQLVRAAQGLNLYKLHRVHRIYKKVIHDLIGVEDASSQLDELLAQPPVFPPWACVLLYGFSSAAVTPFAFGGGWVNLPISFGIGICVAILQFYVAPKSNLYSNVFEVAASIVVSFLGRALGSISGANICFGAIVQGSLALILPGYIILCGSLELQSRNLVAGAVRMFYAIIYSLFLGFGITLGAALYGWIDDNATSEAVCSVKLDPKWNILFVPMFTLGLCLINQARLFQIPIMLFISCVGYIVNYFSAKHFTDSTEFTAALGAFVIGIMGNLYSRIWKGLAVSAMLPAIFVQVPGSIASQGSLLAGLDGANRLTSNSSSTSTSSTTSTNSLGFGVTMVQIAIGISVGLFASTIFVYPFGKKQTSVFTL